MSTGVLLFRYHPPNIKPGDEDYNPSWQPSICLVLFLVLSFSAALAFQKEVWWAAGLLGGLTLCDFVALLLFKRPAKGVPKTFACPLVPWVPCAGILINMFMLAGLQQESWIRLCGFQGVLESVVLNELFLFWPFSG